jgi:hypothetical protein
MGMDGSSIVHIYGYDFDYEPLGGDFNDGLVSGYWADDSSFSISLKNWQTPTYDHIVFHEIPEPASFSLLAAGIWGMYKKKHISENNRGNLV